MFFVFRLESFLVFLGNYFKSVLGFHSREYPDVLGCYI